MRCFIAVVILVFLGPSDSFPRVWTVEKDGSGDYSIIQDAVDAAASGDTIRIGPGRFNDLHVRFCYTETSPLRIFVSQEELTIVGSGVGETVVGPIEPFDYSQEYNAGIFADSYCGNQSLSVAGIRFENMGTAVYIGEGTRSAVEDCVFFGNNNSVNVQSDSTSISNCGFEFSVGTGQFVLSYFQDFFEIEGCSFLLDGHRSHFQFEGTKDVFVKGCDIVGGYGGMIASSGAHVSVLDSRFDQQNGYGASLAATGGPVFFIRDCIFSNQNLAFRQSDGAGRWEIEGTTVTDVTLATLGFGDLGGGYIRNSILAKGEKYVVLDVLGLKNQSEEDFHFDMTNNWWGTDDPDSIQAWIFDANDDPNSGFIIDWDPFKAEPLAADKQSLDSLKSMFR